MKKKIFYFIVLSTIVVILAKSREVMTYTRDAITLCYDFIIPSLFPFFVCSGLLIYSGFGTLIANYAGHIMRPLFNVAPSGATAFIMGIISGFPSGAICAKDLYKCGNLSKSEAERLLAFCNNSGPLFIIGALGVGIYGKVSYGIILYVIHIISSIIVGIIFRNYGKSAHVSPPTYVNTKEMPLSRTIAVSLSQSANNIITVCFSIIFFSAISRTLLDIIPMSEYVRAVIIGICEFSTGALGLSALDLTVLEKLVLSSFIVGFSGLCVHIQVMAVTADEGLSLKPYILGKCLHSIIAAVMTAAIIYVSPGISGMFSENKFILSTSFMLSVLILAVSVVLLTILGLLLKGKSKVS